MSDGASPFSITGMHAFVPKKIKNGTISMPGGLKFVLKTIRPGPLGFFTYKNL
jgi:hypothetical protein